MTADLVLVCYHCRWRPPDNFEVAIVGAHFDMEDGHDPADIRMEMVAICDRCDVEMPVERTWPRRAGGVQIWHACPKCRRQKVVVQQDGSAGDR